MKCEQFYLIFLSCSKHGPNEHPIKDEHGHHKYVHKKSQSKINHYSKDQDTLVLSSDLPVKEPHIAEINEKIRHNPSLIELKPNVYPKESDHYHHHTKHSAPSHSSAQHDFHELGGYQPVKFRPHYEIKGYRPPMQQAHHLEEYEGPSSYSSSSSEYFQPSSSSHSHEQPHVISYKPSSPVILVKKPEIKKVKLITPGLKQYATIKHINRNDYLNYNKNRPRQEERGEKIIHYRRNPRMLLSIPQYAPDFAWLNRVIKRETTKNCCINYILEHMRENLFIFFCAVYFFTIIFFFLSRVCDCGFDRQEGINWINCQIIKL